MGIMDCSWSYYLACLLPAAHLPAFFLLGMYFLSFMSVARLEIMRLF